MMAGAKEEGKWNRKTATGTQVKECQTAWGKLNVKEYG